MKSLVAGVPRLRCLSLLILALAAGCQADGPELVTTSSGDVYLLRDGVLFHIQGDEATRVQGDAPFDPPPSEILKEFTDTISYTPSSSVRTDLKLKYFGPSDVRYRLTLTPLAREFIALPKTEDCLREASPFLQVLLEDVDGFRIGTVRVDALSAIETGFLDAMTPSVYAYLDVILIGRVMNTDRPLTDSTVWDSISDTSWPDPPDLGGVFVAAVGRLGLSAAEFEQIAQASTQVPPICT